eukprot:4006944-Pleurochrysis_carterae.AAC.2
MWNVNFECKITRACCACRSQQPEMRDEAASVLLKRQGFDFLRARAACAYTHARARLCSHAYARLNMIAIFAHTRSKISTNLITTHA